MNVPDLFLQKHIFEESLAKILDAPCREDEFVSKRLLSAVFYALSSGGKRLRPLLVLSMALVHRASLSPAMAIKRAMSAALAVEFVHTYSLIHDDLPAMDNDDFRRGRLSVHRRFDEGLAILAGDALLADAFFLVSSAYSNAALMCRELSLAAGSRGLAAGQSEDLYGENSKKNASYWIKINQLKTARLFEASAVLGGLSVNADQQNLTSIRAFGRLFGEAFQIKDDQDDEQGLFAKESPHTLARMLEARLFDARKINRQFLHQQPLTDLLHFAFATAV